MAPIIHREVEIPASRLADPDTFEAARTAAYAISDSDMRMEALSRLADATEVVGGAALSHIVLEAVTRTHAMHRAYDELEAISDEVARLKTDVEHQEPTYRVTVDEGRGITGVMRLTRLPKDEEAIARAVREASRLPSGPRQNRSYVTAAPIRRRRSTAR